MSPQIPPLAKSQSVLDCGSPLPLLTFASIVNRTNKHGSSLPQLKVVWVLLASAHCFWGEAPAEQQNEELCPNAQVGFLPVAPMFELRFPSPHEERVGKSGRGVASDFLSTRSFISCFPAFLITFPFPSVSSSQCRLSSDLAGTSHIAASRGVSTRPPRRACRNGSKNRLLQPQPLPVLKIQQRGCLVRAHVPRPCNLLLRRLRFQGTLQKFSAFAVVITSIIKSRTSCSQRPSSSSLSEVRHGPNFVSACKTPFITAS